MYRKEKIYSSLLVVVKPVHSFTAACLNELSLASNDYFDNFFSRNLRGKVFKKIVKYYKKGVLFNQDNDVFFFESAPLKGHNMYKV